MAIWGSSSSNAASSSESEIKTSLMRQVQQEAAMANARSLISKVNEHCFDACVPAPGSTLSSAENTCLSQCMEKYISLWNTASRTYIARVTAESKKLGGQDTIAMNELATAPTGSSL
ncbi:protein translocase subunit TIM13 [Aspergillus clavatus NRRL 1]|uniref:Mitochondrial import inner membrane translocase subunit n=1 Tax=Aspergillus clavatus (strain ATCC 1007 / CBS 513.65 / DSM 816 / NCTC 3887 / NRRL 1 / QM 1276 / 107) TaxID=344612 RepID=A1C6Q3_ASPCL|nr:mitochondrial intermembrane space translocase subunit Tim13, putative [Aspergillus clavatus NRRL 1]EAW14074.1 mitochondrial intermembrane space translocase subunit Tim13, putative [Aspergillus clavatus NRRL 1]